MYNFTLQNLTNKITNIRILQEKNYSPKSLKPLYYNAFKEKEDNSFFLKINSLTFYPGAF